MVNKSSRFVWIGVWDYGELHQKLKNDHVSQKSLKNDRDPPKFEKDHVPLKSKNDRVPPKNKNDHVPPRFENDCVPPKNENDSVPLKNKNDRVPPKKKWLCSTNIWKISDQLKMKIIIFDKTS